MILNTFFLQIKLMWKLSIRQNIILVNEFLIHLNIFLLTVISIIHKIKYVIPRNWFLLQATASHK